jgi:DNA-binding transcriptional ArsR family regulator
VAIIRHLGERTLCVNALSNLIGVSPGAVSQHLRILKDAGLVESDRRGYSVH